MGGQVDKDHERIKKKLKERRVKAAENDQLSWNMHALYLDLYHGTGEN